MLFTRVSTQSAASRLRRPRPFALGLLFTILTTAAAVAVPQAPPPPDDPVGALQEILKAAPAQDLDARLQKMNKLIDQMELDQLSRALLLQDWPSQAFVSSEVQDKRLANDENARKRVAQRFVQKAQDAIKAVRAAPQQTEPALRSASWLAKAATANLIGETAAAARKLDRLAQIGSSGSLRTGSAAPKIHVGYLAELLKDLTPDLVELAKQRDANAAAANEEARRSAARALGQIEPLEPAKVVGTLAQLMDDAKNPLDLRVTAANALVNLSGVASEEMQSSLGLQEGVQSRFVDYTELVWKAVLQKGLAPSQPVEIRRACLHAFARITLEMLDISVIPEKNFATFRSDSDDAAIALQEENKYYHRLAGVFDMFQKNAAPLAAAVEDPDPEARQTAISILSDLAVIRQRLKNLAAGETPAEPSVAPTPTEPTDPTGKRVKPQAARFAGAALILAAADEPIPPKKKSEKGKSEQEAFDSLSHGLEKTVAALKQQLTAPDVASRRAAMDVLESLGEGSFSAVDAITEALRDPDIFVRWAAARTLGELTKTETAKKKFSSDQAEAAVLGTTDLLRDQDLGVRLAAATALERFGPRARSAAPTLTRMLNHSQTVAALNLVPNQRTEPELVTGDPTVRITAFRALEAIGGEELQRALPEAVIALNDHSVQVRQAAADTIGRAGPKATEAYRDELVRALGKALEDPEGDVRRSVSGALLRLMPPKSK
jgi:HEAT repeat protein